MSANYSDELFTTQPRLGGSRAAGEMLTKIHKITINSALVLRILDQWPEWARLHTSCSFLFIWLLHPHNNIFASLKVASHPRLPIRFGTGDWVMKIFAKRLCAMCNVNNVLQTGHWHWAAPADKCSHLGMLSGAAAVCLVWARHQLRWNKTVRWLNCVNLSRENTGINQK